MADYIVLAWVAFIFLAAVFFSCASFIRLFQNKKIGFNKGFLVILSACVVAFLLSLSIRPAFHRVYQDEFTYISQSANILSSGKASITFKGTLFHPEAFAPLVITAKFPGFSWLEAVTLFLTRDPGQSYFILNLILAILSVAIVYRIIWSMTASVAVAWWSAIFWASLPARITYSMSASSDIAGSFFFLLFLLFLSEYRLLNSRRILYAALFCGIYSVCIKPFYGVFVVLGLAVVLYIYRQGGLIDKKAHKQIWIDAFCLFLPVMIALPSLGSKAGAWSFSFVSSNIYTSASYLFDHKQNTVLTSLAALVAVGQSIFHKKDNLVNWFAGWFLLGFLMLSAFCAGGLSYPSQAYSDRYFLFLAFPFVFLAAKGMVDIITRPRLSFLGPLFFIVLLVNAFSASYGLTQEARENFHFKKALLLKQVFHLVPDEAYILDECAAFLNTITVKRSIQMDFFVNGDHPKEVVFLRGLSDGFYDSEDPQGVMAVKKILNSEYGCKPLTVSPLKEAYLSVAPYLCLRKQD